MSFVITVAVSKKQHEALEKALKSEEVGNMGPVELKDYLEILATVSLNFMASELGPEYAREFFEKVMDSENTPDHDATKNGSSIVMSESESETQH